MGSGLPGGDAELQADAADAELSVGAHCPNAYPTLLLHKGVEGGAPESPPTAAADCLEAIRTAPLPQSPVRIREGQSVCVVTSPITAELQGTSQKIVALTFQRVASNKLTLIATAWTAP